MKIAPLKMTDPWYSRVTNDGRADAQMLRGVPCDVLVQMDMIEIGHHGSELNYRPYLHLKGQLTEVHPDVELPYGITELPFRASAGGTKDSFYEFTDDQLSELAAKGYFTERFRVPEAMVGITWELPSKADFLVVAPASMDDPPLVFVGLHDQNTQVLHEADSGYRLADHFPDYSVEAPTQERAQEKIHGARTRGDQINDLFFGEDLPEGPDRYETTAPDRSGQEDELSAVPSGVFDRLMLELRAEREREEAARTAGVDYDPRSPEALWRDGVAPGVADVLSPGAEAVIEDARAADDIAVSEGVDDLFADEKAEEERQREQTKRETREVAQEPLPRRSDVRGRASEIIAEDEGLDPEQGSKDHQPGQ